MSMGQSERRRRRGFTIIELLVSFTVLGVVLTLVGAGLRIMTQKWEINTRRIQTLDMVSRAVDILKRDAGNLQRVVAEGIRPPRFLFAGRPQDLAFVALEPPFPTRPGLYFINYRVETDGRNIRLVRARARFKSGMLRFPGATPANRVPIIQGNYHVKFSYGRTADGRASWQGHWPFPNRLPDLIRVEILHSPSALQAIPPIIVRVRADAELTCLANRAGVCSAKTDGMLQSQSGKKEKDRPEVDSNDRE